MADEGCFAIGVFDFEGVGVAWVDGGHGEVFAFGEVVAVFTRELYFVRGQGVMKLRRRDTPDLLHVALLIQVLDDVGLAIKLDRICHNAHP